MKSPIRFASRASLGQAGPDDHDIGRLISRWSFRYRFAGAAQFGWKVLQLGESVFHRQHRLSVINVDAGDEVQRRDCRSEDIDEAQRLMTGHQVPATFLAILPLAERRLLERCDMLSPGFHLHSVCFPETESVYRTSRPGAAGTTMTIAHCLR